MKDMTLMCSKGKKIKAKFNANGQVTRTNESKYKSYIEMLPRTKVPIDIKELKQVPKDIKKSIFPNVLV